MDETKEIVLDVYHTHFDQEPIENRRVSTAEWNELKNILGKGIEVENTSLLAISAVLRFVNDNGETKYAVTFFWTSNSGDVYFQNKQGWFKVSDRTSVRNVLRAKSGK
jgi:hypothetical protein